MEYWRTVVKNPIGKKAMDEFAITMDNTHKIVFSCTLQHVDWKTARLAKGDIQEEVAALRQEAGKDIFAGSRSLIVSLLNLQLIDELQLCVQPIIAGKGLPLFENISDRIDLKLIKAKTFGCGAVILYYKPEKL